MRIGLPNYLPFAVVATVVVSNTIFIHETNKAIRMLRHSGANRLTSHASRLFPGWKQDHEPLTAP
jgi:hypothetical protein